MPTLPSFDIQSLQVASFSVFLCGYSIMNPNDSATEKKSKGLFEHAVSGKEFYVKPQSSRLLTKVLFRKDAITLDTFISFLNDNQGAAMFLLTLVYVVATIIIVYYNKRSIDEMKASREAESRPYLLAYFALIPDETKSCQLIVKNSGKSGAIIKDFSIDPEVQLVKGMSACNFFSETIMAPNQSIQLLVIDEDLIMDKLSYSINLKYEDMQSRAVYSESYLLNQQYFGESGSVSIDRSGMSKPENAILDIAHSLNAIKNSML